MTATGFNRTGGCNVVSHLSGERVGAVVGLQIIDRDAGPVYRFGVWY